MAEPTGGCLELLGLFTLVALALVMVIALV